MATAHYSNFGAFSGDIMRASDHNGYIRYNKRHVDLIKKWLGRSSPPGATDCDIQRHIREEWEGKASEGSILVAMSTASIEEWRGWSR